MKTKIPRRVPPQRELAQRLGASRPTVREAVLQLEGMGLQLFDRIDGDYFTILGLPLLPLLAQLRLLGAVQS